MSLNLVRKGEGGIIEKRPAARIVELSADELYEGAAGVLDRLSQRAEIILVRKLPEALHVRELLLNFVRDVYSNKTALKVKATLFDRESPPDEQSISAFVAAARHLRDTGAMSALFSQLVQRLGLPLPVNIDCGYLRLVLPNDLLDLMETRQDLVQRDDWYNSPPHDETEPIFTRGSAFPHRDISRPHYAFQFNLWFPLTDLSADQSLLFFPDSYYDYKERIEGLMGDKSKGFEHDAAAVSARISANPNPREWGFGEPISREMAFGDVYLFYCQQVHGSPVRTADTQRISVEIRVACRSLDDNTGYRRTFSNLNNFLPEKGGHDAPSALGIERANAIADFVGHHRGNDEISACAQLHLNSLFPSPYAARRSKEIARSAEAFDPAPQVASGSLARVAAQCDRFPFAEDRSVVLARLFLRRGEDDKAATIVAEASQRSQSYFWQLRFAHLAIRAHRKDLARALLDRCRSLAEAQRLDAYPFAPGLSTPSSPIIAILPDHALRAVAAISESIDNLPDGAYGSDVWYLREPRLFHPHTYFIRTHGDADFHKAGSLFLAIPTGHPFFPEDVVAGKFPVVCFGETMEELEYECLKHRIAFATATTSKPALHGSPGSVPRLIRTVGTFNIVDFDGRSFGIPHGLPVVWGKDRPEDLVGVICAETAEQVEILIARDRNGFDRSARK